MRRKLIALLMAAVMMLSLSVTASAASAGEKQTADALHELGLFLGTGDNADGTPNYELDGNLTRAQAIVLLVRMLGKEQEVLNSTYIHPFKDTEAWYDKYVGYAYVNKLTNGTGAATYSGGATTTEQMFATFCLRALGYDDQRGDFTWDKASDKAKELGIEVDLKGSYTRGEAVLTFWDVLNTNQKGSDKTLAEKLQKDGVFTKGAFEKALKTAGDSNALPEDTIMDSSSSSGTTSSVSGSSSSGGSSSGSASSGTGSTSDTSGTSSDSASSEAGSTAETPAIQNPQDENELPEDELN